MYYILVSLSCDPTVSLVSHCIPCASVHVVNRTLTVILSVTGPKGQIFGEADSAVTYFLCNKFYCFLVGPSVGLNVHVVHFASYFSHTGKLCTAFTLGTGSRSSRWH